MDNNNVVVLYPSAGIGHLISMVELGKLVLSHSSSIISSIIILTPSFPSITGSYSCYISSVSSSFPSITFLSLPCSVPLLLGDPCNYEDFEHLAFEILRENNPNVLHCLKSIISPISAFIIDLFCFPALEISQTLNIPTYFFFTSNASALACYLNFPSFDKKVSYDNNFVANNNNTYYCGSYDIPGLFSVPASHMIDHFHKRGASYYKFIEMARAFPRSNGIIINTFESLEVAAVDGLIKGTCLPCTKIPPIYCVGPLIANRGETTGKNKRHECLTWLDSQPKTSVVYLGFGSRGMFSKEQLCEIAFGLERSGVRFLWAVRAPPSGEKGGAFTQTLLEPNFDQLLPFGFLDRVQDRGYVVKSWVPQIEVLGHPSVGGFVSHCGWNSTLEALILGVPIVAWPLYAEQRFNKFLLVNKIGIALPMDESSQNRFVTSCEIEKRLKQILNSKEGDLVRKRIMEFKDKAANTQIEGGSTSLALNVLINSWKKHI